MPIQIVRCKDCKRFKQSQFLNKQFYECIDSPFNDNFDPLIEPDDFCSYGIQKHEAKSEYYYSIEEIISKLYPKYTNKNVTAEIFKALNKKNMEENNG